ncbi:MAG: FecR family protein [Patescibacteria group bacterium]|nr:FecR family protein [Patescibacteria group bacterium]
MLNFNANKLNKAFLDSRPEKLGPEDKELFELGGKLAQTRLVDSRNIEIDAFFAETLKEKLYYGWADEKQERVARKKSIYRYASGLTFAFSAIVLAIYLGIRFFVPFGTDPVITNNNFIIPPPTPVGAPIMATLVYTQGTVEIWENNYWASAAVETLVTAQRQIRTGEASRAVLAFSDGSAIRLGANAHIIVEEANENSIIIQQIVGESYSRVSKSGSLVYTVRSLNAETTALGTAFGVEIEGAGSIHESTLLAVRALESNVNLKMYGASGTSERILLQGEKAVIENRADSKQQSTSISSITDSELAIEFYSWNRELDSLSGQPLGRLENIFAPAETAPAVVGAASEPAAAAPVAPAAKPVEIKQEAKILLYASPNERGVYLNWIIENIESPYGFNIIQGTTTNPTFPPDNYFHFPYSYGRHYFYPLQAAGEYHFRICAHNENGSCGAYSNEVMVQF